MDILQFFQRFLLVQYYHLLSKLLLEWKVLDVLMMKKDLFSLDSLRSQLVP